MDIDEAENVVEARLTELGHPPSEKVYVITVADIVWVLRDLCIEHGLDPNTLPDTLLHKAVNAGEEACAFGIDWYDILYQELGLLLFPQNK